MSAQTPGEPRKDVAATVQAMADNARAKSRAKQRDELAARHAAGQLALSSVPPPRMASSCTGRWVSHTRAPAWSG